MPISKKKSPRLTSAESAHKLEVAPDLTATTFFNIGEINKNYAALLSQPQSPETAKMLCDALVNINQTVAPLVGASATETTEQQNAEENDREPYVPEKPLVFDHWVDVWDAIRPDVEAGYGVLTISRDRWPSRRLKKKDSYKTVLKIVRAGRAGLLNQHVLD